MCRTRFKNRGLWERPLTENGGLSEWPSRGKNGILELKITKKTYIFLKGSVWGSGTGSLDSESRDPVPDLETQSLDVRYRIPRQPYEDCLGVRE